MEVNKPIIISIVSGKGGCGKTRISTALARFLSQNLNVLLVDMDLHNQGLTTLINPKIRQVDHTIHKILNPDYCFDELEIIKINDKIFFVPSIDQNSEVQKNLKEIGHKFTLQEVFENINKFIKYLKDSIEYPIDCIIFDNTGLPDEFSIGASLCSDKVLIITQPDDVSWKGALNFYTKFNNNKGNVDSVSFVVNNVPKKYTQSTISDLFGFSFNFLVFIPFEYGILESFGRNPFEDEFLPSTQFYQKIGYIGTSILKQMNREDLISEAMAKYSNESIKIDLKEKYTRSLSRKEIRFELTRQLTISLILTFVGMYLIFNGLGLDMIEKFIIEIVSLIIGILLLIIGMYIYIIQIRKYISLVKK